MDGYEVARRLRQDECCQDAVIIAVSGYGQDEDRRRSREAGFDHHLVKPVDHDALITLLAHSGRVPVSYRSMDPRRGRFRRGFAITERRMTTRATLLALALLAPALVSRSDAAGPVYERRWVWIMANLAVDKEADRVIGLIERAGKDGYNGVVLSDNKFNILDRIPPPYFANAARIKEAARKAKVEIIPAIFPIGYSNALLANDPNLAEGMPVESAPYVVRGARRGS